MIRHVSFVSLLHQPITFALVISFNRDSSVIANHRIPLSAPIVRSAGFAYHVLSGFLFSSPF